MKKSYLLIIFIVVVFIFVISVPGGNNNPASTQNKVAQETSKPKSQAELGKITESYCNNRANATRSYPVLDIQVGNSGSAKVIPEQFKPGNKLTLEDCTKALNYLALLGKEDNLDKIATQGRWIGMDNIDLLYSAGMPDDVNTTTNQNGSREQWVYNGSGNHTMYIYLENKVVTSWQDF